MVYFQLQKKYLWHLVSKLLETSKEFWWFIGFFFIHLLFRTMFQWRVYEGGLFTTDQIFQKNSQRRIFQNLLIPNRKS